MKKTSFILMLAMLFLAASCNQNQNAEPQNDAQEPVSAIEQQQPVVQRTAFIPVGGTPDFVNAAEKSVDAVVHIKTKILRQTTTYNDFFGALLQQFYGMPGQTQKQYLEAYGSGVVITPDGYIVTNNHVVDGADEVEVTFNNHVKKTATIIATDPTTDLALIKIDGSNYDFLTFGDSDNVRIGEWVLAVGNPFRLSSTVTAGIVSAKARDLSILGEGTSVESFIQTDAAVNPGNSGGALVNLQGELIGINAAIASHTGSYEGYSFAIPSNIVRKVVDDLLLYGETQRGYLGVQVGEMTEELAQECGLDIPEGMYVASADENGAAYKAGIRNGDAIMAINGKKLNSRTQLIETVRQYRPGDQVNVEVVRSGQRFQYDVTLLNESGSVEIVKKGDKFYNSDLGLTLQAIDQNDKTKFEVKNGLKIAIIHEGPFQGSGIPEGFIILTVNGMNVDGKEDLQQALANSRRGRIYFEGIYPNGMKVSFEYRN